MHVGVFSGSMAQYDAYNQPLWLLGKDLQLWNSSKFKNCLGFANLGHNKTLDTKEPMNNGIIIARCDTVW